MAEAGGGTMTSVSHVHAVAGQGLEGDRYFSGKGTFSKKPGSGRQVTLIEVEAVTDVRRICDTDLAIEDTRRNIVTRGIDLNALVDQEFLVGDVRMRGTRLCTPCTVAFPDQHVKHALTNRGGLRADVLSDGSIEVGSPIRTVE